MRFALMDEDLRYLVGQLKGGFDAITEHLRRQDDSAVRAEAEREARRERDKNEAIGARERDKAELQIKLQSIDEKQTQTYGMSTVAYRWVTESAPPLVKLVGEIGDRVTAIEGGKRDEVSETRGEVKTWAFIGAIATALGTALAGVITYGRDAVDFVKGIGH